MATQLEAVPKYEAFVDSQLARVRSRLRALEVGRSLLAIGVVTLGYFLALSLFDLATGGAADGLLIAVRIAAFAAYLLFVAGLLVQLGVRLYRRINPFYAAKQLEDTIADAKNSVINWLDLKERDLPVAIRGAVGQRAARELKQTDPDKAVNPKSNWILGGTCAALALGALILFALGPNQFGSLLRRSFAPFAGSGLGTKTEITLLTPPEGNAAVPLNQRVDFLARIEGRFPKVGQPGAPRLLYRYQAADPHVPLPLDENPDGNWGATLTGDQVLNGFWYKIAAGDAETQEYQIKVHSLPHVQRFEITYHYRPYRKLADDKVVFPNEQAVIPRIIDYRGTDVDLVVRTNRALRQGAIEVDQGGAKTELPGEILPSDPKAMRVRLKLEKRGSFQVLFTAQDGERNTDRSPYQIEVLDDQAPRVRLTKPGKDISLPANGTLELAGTATDDIGLTTLVLRLRVLEGEAKPDLAPKPYRHGKSFQFDNGTFPDFIDYKDFVPLDKLRSTKNEPVSLKVGTILEYWLKATDNCDYPDAHGNVGKSAAYKITITDPTSDKKKQQEHRRQAEQQQKKHDQKQDKQNAQENQKRNQSQSGGNSQDDKQKRDFEDKKQQLENQLKKDNQGNNEPKSSKSNQENNNQGTGKPGETGGNTAEQKNSNNPEQAGAKKDAGQQGKTGQQGKAGQAKNQDEQQKNQGGSPEANSGTGVDQKNKESPQTDKGVAKQPSAGQAKQAPGQAKSQGQPGEEKTSSAKTNESPGGKESQGQAKANDGMSNNAPRAKAGGKGATQSGEEHPQLGKKDGAGKSPTTQPGTAKGADPGETKTATLPKEGHGDPREATAQRVRQASKKLTDPKEAAKAREELTRIAKEARDPNARKAAQEALDAAGRQAKTGPQPLLKDGNPNGSADGGKKVEQKTDAATAKAPGTGQEADGPKAQAKSGGTTGAVAPKARGTNDEAVGTKPNADFQKRAGNLQLDTLRERVTPETLKKLGWSEQDWQQFLRDAAKYQVRAQETARKIPNQRGTGSLIPGASLRAVDANPSAATDPLNIDSAPVPPEFRNAQRQFTTNPSGKQ